MNEKTLDEVLSDFKVSVKNLISKYFESDIQPTLYHYTSCETLISIVTKQEFWLSNVEFMNDKLEVNYSMRIIQTALAESSVDERSAKIFLKTIKKHKKRANETLYVLSLSKDEDSLNLWNNYGKNDGYSIGIDTPKFITKITERRIGVKTSQETLLFDNISVFGNVLYDEASQVRFFRELFDHYYSFILNTNIFRINELNTNKIISEMFQVWDTILKFSYMIKQKEHQIENEFRFIAFNDNHQANFFRVRNGIVLPYIKIGFEKNELMPIKEICIGPKINENIASAGIKYLLKKNYRKTNITKSSLKLLF
jgi:Protein of unknown function (DUF2971).